MIIGFGLREPDHRRIYDYVGNISGDKAHVINAKRINPYLVDATDAVLLNRRAPICHVPLMSFGSMPNDGGHLLLSNSDRAQLLAVEPKAARWIRPFLGAEEFINGQPRWCLWLQGIPATELRAMAEVYKRVQAVKVARLASTRPETQKLADIPYLFGEIRQPDTPYLLVPSVSSELREFVPVGFLTPDVIASNLALTIANATLYEFAMMCSTMHNAWMRAVCGRLKSDYRYSASIVYNNYPWPQPTPEHRAAMEAAGQAILDARAKSPGSTLADLYDPVAMPLELRKAHIANDRAVDAAYGFKGDMSDAGRVALLFSLYSKLTSLLPPEKPKRARKISA